MCGGGGPSSIRSFVVEGDKARQRAERLFGGERLVPEVRAGGCVCLVLPSWMHTPLLMELLFL